MASSAEKRATVSSSDLHAQISVSSHVKCFQGLCCKTKGRIDLSDLSQQIWRKTELNLPLKSKEREKTLGNQAAMDSLSISVRCKEKSRLEENVEHSFRDRGT